MVTPAQPDEPSLTRAEIDAAVFARLEKYKTRGVFEQFALFMGMAQLLELTLKSFYARRYGVEVDSIERWTLGQVKNALRDRGLRPDFLDFLASVVNYRNRMAHSFMADMFLMREVFGKETRFETRELEKGIYELEQLFVLFEWSEEHDAWGNDIGH